MADLWTSHPPHNNVSTHQTTMSPTHPTILATLQIAAMAATSRRGAAPTTVMTRAWSRLLTCGRRSVGCRRSATASLLLAGRWSGRGLESRLPSCRPSGAGTPMPAAHACAVAAGRCTCPCRACRPLARCSLPTPCVIGGALPQVRAAEAGVAARNKYIADAVGIKARGICLPACCVDAAAGVVPWLAASQVAAVARRRCTGCRRSGGLLAFHHPFPDHLTALGTAWQAKWGERKKGVHAELHQPALCLIRTSVPLLSSPALQAKWGERKKRWTDRVCTGQHQVSSASLCTALPPLFAGQVGGAQEGGGR